MKTQLFLFLLTVTACITVNGQIVLNEIAGTNLTTIADEDGEYPDWIELYNAGITGVSLEQYALTDDLDLWNKWLLPDTMLMPGERMVVFASEKNRNAYNAEIASIDHWETAVYDNDIWDYFEADEEPEANWNNILFAGTWDTGMGGFGFGDDDDNTEIDEDVRAVYYRKEFEVEDKTKLIRAIINMDYDDGFVLYLNGVIVGTFGFAGIPDFDDLSSYAHEAQMYDGGNPDYIELDSTALAALLVNGTNVIAAQVHNKSAGSDDLTGRTFLSFAITDNTVYYEATPAWFEPVATDFMHTNFKIGNGETLALFDPSGLLLDSVSYIDVTAGLVMARISDGGPWCISDLATPDLANTGICYTAYSAVPVISPSAGFYTGDQLVSITGINVKYTLDGTEPGFASDDYIAPFTLSVSTIVKAKCFEADKLPSAMVTQSIFINEPTELPVVSISATPCDLFDLADSCLGAYDNIESFVNDNPQAKVVIEYFNADKSFAFAAETKFEAVGNYSIGEPQKGLQFTCDEDFNSPDNMEYPIYQKDKPEIEKYHSFRIRNTDNDAEATRMRDLVANRMAMPTFVTAAANQNVAAFINGEYWGHYVSRERLDQYFCRDNFGCDPDSVDMIKTSFSLGGGGNYVVESGSDTAFFAMHDYCLENDLSIPANYTVMLDKIDEQNWVDYYATEIYIANDDWMSFILNNIRLFRSSSPEIEWKFILWDLAYSQNVEFGTGASANTLENALEDNNYYTDMFTALLDNTVFHDYFINRFADLLNYYYTPDIIHALIDENTDEMIGEMDAQDDRWNTGNATQVMNDIEVLKDFHDARPGFVRDDIENYFDLNGQVDITLDVNPPGAGFVKISTIMPSTLPWTGIYFDGVPVTISAIANPGFTFVNWSDNDFIDTLTNLSFTANVDFETTFTANFNGALIPNPIVISEIHYNSDSTLNSGDWVELHNTSDIEIHLTDYRFSDKVFYNDYNFPDGTSIDPYGYLVVTESLEEFHTIYPDVENAIGGFTFNLQNDGDSITLLDMTQTVLSAFSYDDSRPWPVTADNYGRTMERMSDFPDPALADSWFAGCIGGSPGTAFIPCLENPLVYEINYNSADTANAGDWFELYNQGPDDQDVSGWTVKDKNGNAFTFSSGTTILADSFLVIFQDEVLFDAEFPDIENKVGPVAFGLSSEDDIISIYGSDGIIFQSVGYDNEAPYPLTPDGGGMALQLVNVLENLNEGTNWMESCPGGSPGMDYFFPCTAPIDTTEDTIIVEQIQENVLGTLHVYPNPANNQITVEIDNSSNEPATLTIFNLSGQFMEELKIFNSSVVINIAEYTPGIYLVRWVVSDKQYVLYFVKDA